MYALNYFTSNVVTSIVVIIPWRKISRNSDNELTTKFNYKSEGHRKVYDPFYRFVVVFVVVSIVSSTINNVLLKSNK